MSSTFVLRGLALEPHTHVLSVDEPAELVPREQVSDAPPPKVVPLEDKLRAEYERGRGDALREVQARHEEDLGRLQAEYDARWQAEREEARAEAWMAGREEAASAAAAAAEAVREEARELLRRLDELATEAVESVREQLRAQQDDVVAFCHEMVCKILGAEALTSSGVQGLVARALEQLPGRAVEIAAHPSDLALLRDWDYAPAAGIAWVPDETLELGGVRVRGETVSLDARLQTQVTALTRTLLETRAAATPRRPS